MTGSCCRRCCRRRTPGAFPAHQQNRIFSDVRERNYATCMQEGRAQSLTPPEDLRPAQLGIVLLGRVILGHISATLVDLAQRGFLRIDAIPGDGDPDWLLTSLRDQAAGRSVLLRFEATLLDGLFARQSPVRVPEISQELILPAPNRVRSHLTPHPVPHAPLRPRPPTP